MTTKVHVRRDDVVEVISGEDRGKQGKVLKVLPAKGRVIVQGCNVVVKNMRRSRDYPSGARIRKEAAIDASNVLVVCPGCNKGRRYTREIRDGKKVRMCKQCRKEIPTLG